VTTPDTSGLVNTVTNTVTTVAGPVTDTVNQLAPTPTVDPSVVTHTVDTVTHVADTVADKGTNAAKEVGKAVSDTVADATGSSGGGRVPAVPAGGGLGVVGIPGLPGSGGLGSPGLSGSAPASGGGDSRPGHDGRDPLGTASLGAFAQMPGGAAPVAGASATGAPAGILGLNPALAALTGTDAQGLLSGAALLASIASSGAPGAGGPGGSGNGDDVLDKLLKAVHSVVDNVPDWSRPIIAALLLLVLILAVRAYLNGRRARRFQRALHEKAADNAVLQAALVPDLPERLGGVALSVDYRPADGLASGGDFYDAFALDEHRVGVILGDVSGHDRKAIRRAADVRHKLRAYLELGFEPRIVLQMAGEALSSTDSLEGDFATAAVAVHDARAGTLTYACAGHPAPIVTGSAAHPPVSVCSSPALGWGLPTGRRQTTVVLGDGDAACFFTDGLIEARNHGGFIGRTALERLVGKLGAQGTAGDLLREVIGLAHEADDDLAALVLRPGAPVAASGARVEELEFEASEVHRKAPERFLAACDAPMVAIERLAEAAQRAVDEGGRGVLCVRFEAGKGVMEAAIEPLHAAPAPARAVA